MHPGVFSRFTPSTQAHVFRAIALHPLVLDMIPSCIDSFDDETQQAFRSLPGIHCLSLDLLALVLSKVDKRDLKNCFPVCKRWNEVMQTRAVWQPHVEREFHSVFPQVTCPNVFLFRFSPLKDKVGWMYWKEWKDTALKRSKDDKTKSIHLKYLNKPLLVLIAYKENKYLQIESDVFVDGSYKLDGLLHYIGLNCVDESWKMFQKGKEQTLHIRWKTPDGNIFEGEGIASKGKAYPHGSGTWTFPDGTTLTGEDVAFAGKIHGHGWFAGEPLIKKQKI